MVRKQLSSHIFRSSDAPFRSSWTRIIRNLAAAAPWKRRKWKREKERVRKRRQSTRRPPTPHHLDALLELGPHRDGELLELPSERLRLSVSACGPSLYARGMEERVRRGKERTWCVCFFSRFCSRWGSARKSDEARSKETRSLFSRFFLAAREEANLPSLGVPFLSLALHFLWRLEREACLYRAVT